MGVKSSRIFFWAIFLGTLGLDQIVKWLMRTNYGEGQSSTLIPGVLDLNLQFNKGIAFGKLQGYGVFLAPIAIVIAIGAAVYTYRHPKENGWGHFAMGLLASGALGNMVDRLVFGRVTDMFETRFMRFPVFNVADACITVAACILIVKWGFEGVHPKGAPAADAVTSVEEPPPTLADQVANVDPVIATPTTDPSVQAPNG